MTYSALPITGFLAAFARTAAWSRTAPFVGDAFLSRKARVALAAILAAAFASMRDPIGFEALLLVIPMEIAIGVLAGMAGRIAIAAAEAGGQLVGLQMALGFAGFFDPIAQEQSLPTRRIALVLAGLAFLSVGGLDTAVRTLAHPIPVYLNLDEALLSIARDSGDILASAVRLAAPILLAGLVANATVAMASRASPALNVFSVMLALFLVIGCTVLWLTAPSYIYEIVRIAEHARDATQGVVFR